MLYDTHKSNNFSPASNHATLTNTGNNSTCVTHAPSGTIPEPDISDIGKPDEVVTSLRRSVARPITDVCLSCGQPLDKIRKTKNFCDATCRSRNYRALKRDGAS